MKINTNVLRQELTKTLKEIELQSDVLVETATKMGIRPEQLRDQAGDWPYGQLLLAKTNVLLALAGLNRKDI